MELFILYLWLKLDTFLDALSNGSIVLALVAGAFLFCMTAPDETFSERMERLIPKIGIGCLSLAILLWGASVALPNTKQTAVLVGGYYALKLADTPEAGKVMSVLRKKANELLDAELAK